MHLCSATIRGVRGSGLLIPCIWAIDLFLVSSIAYPRAGRNAYKVKQKNSQKIQVGLASLRAGGRGLWRNAAIRKQPA